MTTTTPNQTTEPRFQITETPNAAPPDDGDFSHPAFANIPNTYDIDKIAQGLFDDAGIEWPSELRNTPNSDPTNNGVTPQHITGQQFTGTVPSPTVVPPPTTIPVPPQTVNINGREVPADQAQAMMTWYDYLATHPEQASQIVGMITNPQPQYQQQPIIPTNNLITSNPQLIPQQQPTPQLQQQLQQQPQPIFQAPPDFDTDEPVNKFILDSFNQIAQSVNQLSQQQVEQLNQANLARARSDTDSALSKFQSRHPEFTPEEITQVRQITTQLGIVGNFATANPNPSDGIVQALEVGMYQVPSTRNKILLALGQTPPPPAPDPDQVRQQALNALSGSSGSTPRTEPKPRLDNDHDMKVELEKAFQPYFANR